ncbi:unnamed protein product [Pylaiella littoralis]
MEKRTPASKHTHSAGKQSNKNRRHTQESHMRPRLAPDSVKKKKPIASAPHSSTPSSRRMDDIRLIIESSLSDNYMMKKISKVRDELQAVELALADDGTYLGIVDKGELEKRKGQLKRRIRLLQEEGELMQTLRHQLAGGAKQARTNHLHPFAPIFVSLGMKSTNNLYSSGPHTHNFHFSNLLQYSTLSYEKYA